MTALVAAFVVLWWPPPASPRPVPLPNSFTVPGFVDGHGETRAHVETRTIDGDVPTGRRHEVIRAVERRPARRWLRIGQCLGAAPCRWEEIDVTAEDWARIVIGASWEGQITRPLTCALNCPSTD